MKDYKIVKTSAFAIDDQIIILVIMSTLVNNKKNWIIIACYNGTMALTDYGTGNYYACILCENQLTYIKFTLR